jgi:hypothetical protein
MSEWVPTAGNGKRESRGAQLQDESEQDKADRSTLDLVFKYARMKPVPK